MDNKTIIRNAYNNTEVARLYDETFCDPTADIFLANGTIDMFLEMVRPNGRILDLGCGCGQHTIHMASRGFTVVGIDFAESMLQRAQNKIDKLPLEEKERIQLLQGDIQDVDKMTKLYNDYDAALFSFSILHLTKEQALETLTKVNQLLHPNSPILIITTYAAESENDNEKIVPEPFAPTAEKQYFRYYTKRELVEMLSNCGAIADMFNIVNTPDENDAGSNAIVCIGHNNLQKEMPESNRHASKK